MTKREKVIFAISILSPTDRLSVIREMLRYCIGCGRVKAVAGRPGNGSCDLCEFFRKAQGVRESK
jgi:hypothetical protein